jgi:hypothetical protein
VLLSGSGYTTTLARTWGMIGDRPLMTFGVTERGWVASGTLLMFATWLHLVALAVAFAAFARPWRSLRARTRGHEQPA